MRRNGVTLLVDMDGDLREGLDGSLSDLPGVPRTQRPHLLGVSCMDLDSLGEGLARGSLDDLTLDMELDIVGLKGAVVAGGSGSSGAANATFETTDRDRCGDNTLVDTSGVGMSGGTNEMDEAVVKAMVVMVSTAQLGERHELDI